MLHALPITNVLLSPCPVSAEQLTPVAGGHFCADCQRVVQDFTGASQQELAAARAAAPDGRLCGQFRHSQLAAAVPVPPPRLRPQLRRFLLGAVLILLQGLSARQAWAQVCGNRPPFKVAAVPAQLYQLPSSWPLLPDALPQGIGPANEPQEAVFTGMLELTPQFPGGIEALRQFLHTNIHYPATTAEGKVFITFTIDGTGQVHKAKVLKGAHPLLNEEALRVVRLMPRWRVDFRGRQPYSVDYTLPISFILTEEATNPAGSN